MVFKKNSVLKFSMRDRFNQLQVERACAQRRQALDTKSTKWQGPRHMKAAVAKAAAAF
jgi:hypothetical protein